MELGQYDIQYQPRTAIKAQVLVDFIGELTTLNSEPNKSGTELEGNKENKNKAEEED